MAVHPNGHFLFFFAVAKPVSHITRFLRVILRSSAFAARKSALSRRRRYNKSKTSYPMDFEETVRFLEGSALFAGITLEQLRAVAASATVENHPAGSIVIEEDGASDYFYLIVEGRVDIYREEKHLILKTLSTGAVFGLLSIIEHKPRSATVETRQFSILIKFLLDHIAHSLPQGKHIYNASARLIRWPSSR